RRPAARDRRAAAVGGRQGPARARPRRAHGESRHGAARKRHRALRALRARGHRALRRRGQGRRSQGRMSQLKVGIFDWVEASSRPAGEVYEHKLALAAAADKAGLHGYYLAEHQGTPLSIDASPSVLLAAMFQRTKKLRAGALTFCLPWYNPYRFYSEVCMLDHLSNGRLELGVGRGVSPIESLIFGLRSIDESREKYRETLDIFFEACKGKTLNYRGKHYSYQDVELHVKPLQQPYPPLWFPTSNKESIDFTASHGYHTAFLGKVADVKPLFDRYREVWEKHRNDPGRHNAHVRAPYL